MTVDKDCPKCLNRTGIRCSKCYECGYDYFANYDEPKPLIIQGVSVPKGTLRHEAKVLTKEEVEANRSSAYKYLEF